MSAPSLIQAILTAIAAESTTSSLSSIAAAFDTALRKSKLLNATVDTRPPCKLAVEQRTNSALGDDFLFGSLPFATKANLCAEGLLATASSRALYSACIVCGKTLVCISH